MKKIKNKYINIICKMSFHILMNYLVITLFEVLDKAIVGNYSVYDFAAVGIGSAVIYKITGSLGVISAAYNIIAAKYQGKNDKNKFNRTFYTVMFFSIIIGIFIIVLSLIGGRVLFLKIFGLDGKILTVCLEYFYISSITVLLNLIIFNFSAYFRNLKNTKISFYSTLISTIINVIFDYLFVYGKFGFPELGAKGAAVGSVLGLLSGISVYLVKLDRNIDIKFKSRVSKSIMKKLVKLYIPLLGQDIIEGTIFAILLTGIVSRLGVYDIAAFNLSESIGSIISLPIYAFSTAAVTLAIQKSFAEENNNSKKIINTSIILALTSVLIIGILISIFPNAIFGLITKDKNIILKVSKIFIMVVIVQIFNIFNQIYKGYLQGLNNERFVFKYTTLVSFISIVWITVLAIKLKLLGVYIGLVINNLILSLIYYLKINRDNCKETLYKI